MAKQLYIENKDPVVATMEYVRAQPAVNVELLKEALAGAGTLDLHDAAISLYRKYKTLDKGGEKAQAAVDAIAFLSFKDTVEGAKESKAYSIEQPDFVAYRKATLAAAEALAHKEALAKRTPQEVALDEVTESYLKEIYHVQSVSKEGVKAALNAVLKPDVSFNEARVALHNQIEDDHGQASVNKAQLNLALKVLDKLEASGVVAPVVADKAESVKTGGGVSFNPISSASADDAPPAQPTHDKKNNANAASAVVGDLLPPVATFGPAAGALPQRIAATDKAADPHAAAASAVAPAPVVTESAGVDPNKDTAKAAEKPAVEADANAKPKPADADKAVAASYDASAGVALTLRGASAQVAAWQEAMDEYATKHGKKTISVDGAWGGKTEKLFQELGGDVKKVLNKLHADGITLHPEHFLPPAPTPAAPKQSAAQGKH